MAMELYNVLVVDDELGNINALERTLRCDYSIFTATNAEDALSIMEQYEMAVVITDHRMPGMDGIQFLEQAQKRFPDTIRIILTAYTDERLLMDAINAGHVYGYIDKPWSVQQIRDMVKKGVEAYEITLASREPHTRALLHSGIISAEQLEAALHAQKAEEKSIGEILIQHGKISRTQLDMALEIQQTKRSRLDEVLVEMGAVSSADLEMAEALQKQEKRTLAEILVDLGYADEEDIYSCYALQLGMPHIPPSRFFSEPELSNLVSTRLTCKYSVLPIDLVGRVLVVSALEPLSDRAKKDIEAETGYKVMAVLSSHE
jgi:CheY-like chemotaxis protein